MLNIKQAKFYLKRRSGALRYITMPNFVEIGQSIMEILQFFDFSKCPPLPSRFFEFVTFYWLKRSRLLRCNIKPNFVKIGANPLQRYCYFSIFKMVAAAILDLFGAYLDHPQRVLSGLYQCAKFGYDRCSSFDNMNVLIFGTFCWKKPIHAPKIGVFGCLTPYMGCNINKSEKTHSCMSPRHLSH